jgi:O-antigen/teichoic acid export membrane protein
MAEQSRSSNKRLAINTIILYGKLIITIIISFLTSRLVLDALGVSDYGLYNVVGGIVSMLNILGTTMIATSYRYMAVELGKGESGNPNKEFNTITVIHIFLALFLIIIGETLGVYYLNVASGKVDDALFVLHLSLATVAFTIVSIPTNGLIVAREKFLFTSIVEVANAVTKLVLIFALSNMDGNRLRYYAVIIAFAQLIIPLSYQIYCRIKDKEVVKWNFNRNKSDYKGILGFAWWMFIGAVACVARIQGAAMIINLFFGTILNAAFGLASQVYNATNQFTTTLRQAAIPQIMKSQSSGNEERSMNLVYYISKYSYLFMLIPAIPLIICISGAIKIWLGVPPKFTDIFIVLMLINGMLANLSAGFDATIQATGNVKKNQIGYSIINLALLPIIFILYKTGMPPYINAIVMIALTIITLIFQCYIMKELTSFNIRKYIDKTILPSLLATAMAWIPLHAGSKFLNDSWQATIISLIIALIWTVISIYIAGTNKHEKQLLTNYITRRIFKKNTL